jgi:hypothetical protein
MKAFSSADKVEVAELEGNKTDVCVQRTMCAQFTIWDDYLCRCIGVKSCEERGLLKKCERGYKFDKTTCECYKIILGEPQQRHLCRAGTVWCVKCGKCAKIKDCSLTSKYRPTCDKKTEIFDKSVCKCIPITSDCYQKYECIDGYEFDFDKCICVFALNSK